MGGWRCPSTLMVHDLFRALPCLKKPDKKSFAKRNRFKRKPCGFRSVRKIADYTYPIGTSRLEGINNKIKVIKRKAYGFHDEEYFALKVKQAFAA